MHNREQRRTNPYSRHRRSVRRQYLLLAMNLCLYVAVCFLFQIFSVNGQSSAQFSTPGTSAIGTSTTSSTVKNFTGECSTLASDDSCKLWDMHVIVVLDERTTDDIFQTIQAFLNNLIVDCRVSQGNSGSSLSIFTPASLNQATNTTQCSSVESCSQLIYINTSLNETFISAATTHDDVIITLFNRSFHNFSSPDPLRPQNRGKVVYFITSVPVCDGECPSSNLILQQSQLANYMNTNGIAFRMIYLVLFDNSRSFGKYSAIHSRFSKARLPFTNFGISELKVFIHLNEISTYPNTEMFTAAFKTLQACPNLTEPNNTWEYFIKYGIPAASALMIIICCGCMCFLKTKYKFSLLKLRRREVEIQAIAVANQNSTLHHTVSLNPYVEIAKDSRQNSHEPNDRWEVAPHALFIDTSDKLGSGAFSTVYKGILIGRVPVFDVYEQRTFASDFIINNEVAVKVLPNHADSVSKQDFLNEIGFMKNLGYHGHIVSMLGCITDPKEPCLVVEYCANGDLLKFLHKNKPNFMESASEECPLGVDGCIRMKDLLSFAWQISDGMEYLSSHDYIHRDVAARNILLTKKLAAKIGDFGLCRVADQALYTTKGGRLPIKWMAIESLKQYTYTTKSDVWSFGVLLFELFTLGDGPYPAIQPLDMISHLEAGNRPSRPALCSENLYDLMSSCWQAEPALRPTFSEIRSKLTSMLDTATEHYGYLDVQNEVEVEQKAEMK